MFSGALQKVVPITHPTDIAAVRRCGQQLAKQLGLDETLTNKLAIVVTETATNILKHAVHGKVILTPVRSGAAHAIEVLALDNGTGISNLASCLRDGMSTSGTSGTGLGAMRRLASHFEAYTTGGKGSAFYMRLAPEPTASLPVSLAIEYGAVNAPMRGEEACGDAWAVVMDQERLATVLVADGLGHGPEAARASQAAVQTLRKHPGLPPAPLMDAIHSALPATRGAAVALAQIDFGSKELHFVGVGNISGIVMTHESSKHLISHNGIVGHNIRKVQQFTLPWMDDAVGVMHSDGLTTNWDIRAYPGLLACHPALIAGVLYRDFARDRDDATVIAFRQARVR
jgi:anti-sigma regulatory factor (Ser/Thr protein kinase)